MPKVVVFVRARDWKRMEADGLDPQQWTRNLVAAAVARRQESAVSRATERPVPPVVAVAAPCPARHPMIPIERCVLKEGHLGAHEWREGV